MSKIKKRPKTYGNQYFKKWGDDELTDAFLDVLHYAETVKDCIHLVTAIKGFIPPSTYHLYASKNSALERIKKDTMAIIAERVGTGAMRGEYKETSSIWRMKQLGEKDEKYQDITTQGDKVNNAPSIVFTQSDE